SFHDVDSNENAFKMAAILGMRDAFTKAGPVLLEPVMDVEITTPEEYQGDIMGDLNRRRGQIQEIENKPNHAVLKVIVPLAEMFGYSTAVRSLTQGRVDFTMVFRRFDKAG
ncbi:MAG: elongation factor G, partial [Deltaproteobacteria bacterium]|nr:elongation factor G [Deltaproteobacteria bacterium]